MGLPKLAPPIARESVAERETPLFPLAAPEMAWTVLGEIGAVLAIVGGVDLLLIWYPFSFQNPEWEFGTVTATLDGMPVLTMGLGLVLAAGLASGGRWLVRLMAVLLGTIGVGLIAAGLLYATTIPLALRAISDPAVEIGLYRAILKTLVQAVAYPAVFLWVAFRSWR